VDSHKGYEIIREAFEPTSRFAQLQRLNTAIAGRTLSVRFVTKTSDAKGMNMISKGSKAMQQHLAEMITLVLSRKYCVDKKLAAITWIEGRGKDVVAKVVIPGKVVKSVSKTTVEVLCNLNMKKILVGSAMNGSVGGFNPHAAHILTVILFATRHWQDAQNADDPYETVGDCYLNILRDAHF
jgi:hydroxymethylglutaryl-CoA reductase (NADPH)